MKANELVEVNNMLQRVMNMAHSMEPGEMTGDIMKGLTQEFGRDISELFFFLITISRSSQNDIKLMNDLFQMSKWDNVRDEFLTKFPDVEYKVWDYIKNPTHRKMAGRGLRVVK